MVDAPEHAEPVDLLVAGAELVATCDDDRRELPGGWVAITDGVISGVGPAGTEPADARQPSAPTAAWSRPV